VFRAMRQYLLVTVNKVLKKALITDRVYNRPVYVKYKDKVYEGRLWVLTTTLPRAMKSKYYLIVPINENELEKLRKDVLEIRAVQLIKSKTNK